MPDPTQIAADRDRRFADWGVAVVVRDVTQSFDPITRETNESTADTPLTALVTPVEQQPLGDAAGHGRVEELQVQIKTEELPALGAATARRIVFEDNEHHVVRQDHSAADQIDVLHCSRSV